MEITAEFILESIFDKGVVFYEFEIGKYKIKIRNITADDYLKIDEALTNDVKKSALSYAQKFLIERIAMILMSINNNDYSSVSVEKKREILKKMPAALLNKILEQHKFFENEIKKALKIEEIEDHFFDEGTSTPKQKQ